jgi:hypothetical protein
VNPPIADASISSPGTFYGDYQGIVADTCGALFLHNDTHLANAPSRDPDFDQGVPRSRFQQVQAARLARPGSEGRPECAAPVTASSRCAQTRAFGRASVRARGRGLRFAFAARPRGVVDVAVRQVSAGRGLLASRPVARFARRGSFAWDGRPTAGGRRAGDGFYVVTLRRRGAAGGRDVRRFAFERRGGRFVRRGRFAAPRSCSVLARFELDRPVFGGRRSAPLTVRYRLRERAAVSVVLRRGARRPEVTTMFKPTRAGRTQSLRISPRGRPRGTYTVQLRVRRPGADLVRRTLSARRL